MAVECPECGCKYCPAKKSFERVIEYRGRRRKMQRRWRVCQNPNCGRGFWSREFVEDSDQAQRNGKASTLNPLYTSDFVKDDNPFLET
ncbi:MAG: hypothetical protein AB7E98_11955 [Pirellulales bacterium]